ncbi:RHS repeat domain-containing protein [Flavobacterium soli]|uniref:RHS repeat domain-containing protein n=1 Tax=Flavobacterium soli TaxID=344881 RepID=UPI00146CA0B1|nr:RHS repeat-associated core domain-containing protein [Flavobacterium soli]
MPTGSWARVITTASSTSGEASHTLYDKRSRPIRTYTANHLGGYTYTDTKLDFTGKPLYTLTRHKRQASSDELLTREEFTYTAQDRLLTHNHRITFQGTAGPVELIAKNEYDALGQLKNKKVGGLASTATGLQKVDFTYNIRGWLKEINSMASLSESGSPTDLFAFRLNYNTVDHSIGNTVTPLYNGNISETYWKSGSDNVVRKYGYVYDNLNRLTDAIYQKPILGNPVIQQVTNSYNEEMAYDRNGNITSMYRNGYLDADGGAIYPIDNLEYQYSHNKLLKVIDHTNSLDGFRDGQHPNGVTESDYFYDANGNMVQDWNKGIDAIVYNHLNLPTRINFKVDQGEKFISYIYNALGQKVSKQVVHQSSTEQVNTVTDYLGGYQYVGGILQLFPTTEGYVSVTNGKDFDYVYNYTDHLGNIRVSYTMPKGSTVLSILEENHYYPFGMKHANYGDGRHDYVRNPDGTGYAVIDEVHRNKYQYKFLGQERQDELGLNWDTFRHRNYDYAIGRFFGVDPITEEYMSISPYQFAHNSPVWKIELEGLEGKPTSGTDVINREPRVLAVFYHGGPDGNGGRTTAAAAGGAGNIYNSTKSYAESKGMGFEGVIIAPAATQEMGVQTGADFLNDNYQSGDTVLIYGYSYGGDNAVNLAEAVPSIPIDGLITVDSSDGLLRGTTVDTSVPDNVAQAFNFFQTNASGNSSGSESSGDSDNPNRSEDSSSDGGSNVMGSRGFPHTSEGKAEVKNIKITGGNVSHGNIQTVAKQNIQKRINEVINGN